MNAAKKESRSGGRLAIGRDDQSQYQTGSRSGEDEHITSARASSCRPGLLSWGPGSILGWYVVGQNLCAILATERDPLLRASAGALSAMATVHSCCVSGPCHCRAE